MNIYSFVLNNPVRHTDMLGLMGTSRNCCFCSPKSITFKDIKSHEKDARYVGWFRNRVEEGHCYVTFKVDIDLDYKGSGKCKQNCTETWLESVSSQSYGIGSGTMPQPGTSNSATSYPKKFDKKVKGVRCPATKTVTHGDSPGFGSYFDVVGVTDKRLAELDIKVTITGSKGEAKSATLGCVFRVWSGICQEATCSVK